jgi:hypothetical protein
MTETDEEYEKRCEEAWSKLVDAQKHKGYHEFPEGYHDEGEDDEGEDELHHLKENWVNDLIGTDEDYDYDALVNAESIRRQNERQNNIEQLALEMRRLKMEHDEAVSKLNKALQSLNP